ncbi:MAG: outer membrane protein assembly factor BamD [Acidobacteriota bacterium]|nr:outer membrane protein assembly factor BamD [Acidobacteriota bacterium]
MQKRNFIFVAFAGLLALAPVSAPAFPFRHKKYENPISKNTLQPDKVLFDRAIGDIEHGRYEVARITLNTLINTYDTSEYLAKAKLAIADSWYREGGAHGLAQAEQGYKDFELFYPNMEEAAESQAKVCDIHYKQMEKADRDSAQATRAEDECRQLLIQYPNSKYRKETEQKLRNVQEVLADKEFKAGDFYQHKGSYPAAANRFSYVTQQYPLYSGSDQALWEMSEAYRKMGDRFEREEGDALTKIVRNYPFSAHLDDAKARLTALKRPIPEADAAAYARQKYDSENFKKQGMFSRATGVITGHPDTSLATKSGAPVMTAMRPPVPVSVPAVAAGTVPPANGGTGVSDVSAGVVANSSLDAGKDARLSTQNGTLTAEGAGTGEQKASVTSNGLTTSPAAQTEAPPPSNHVATAKQIKDYQKAQLKAQQKAARDARKKGAVAAPAVNAAPATTPAATTPAATTPAAAPAPQ